MNRSILALAASSIIAAPASATWSIIIIDTRTGEIALGSATCLTGFDLQANTPVIVRGVGGATAQSFVDSTSQNRTLIRDQLALGTDPADILQLLSTFDNGHQTRQYGIADALGRAATFTGSSAFQWAGGKTGKVGDLVYAVQGNILTGAPVVDAAVEAILNTPGDLAEKLMASMEAARSFGGDGRCSCSPQNPTSCGAPPPSFAKSAHIAYMLISRDGDTDGSLGAYRAGSAPRDVHILDADADGRPDLIAANAASASISFLRNITPPGNSFPVFALPVHFPTGPSPVRAAIADLSGDGIPDIATANSTGNSVSVLLGNGDGTFQPKVDYATAANPVDLVVADLDEVPGLDIAACHASAGVVTILRNSGGGAFVPIAIVPVGAGPNAINAGRFDNDADVDLIVSLPPGGAVRVLKNDGLGMFSLGDPIPVPQSPSAIAVADLDGDADADVIVACSDGQALSFLRQTPGGFVQTNVPIAKRALDAVPVDVDGDGDLDIVTSNNSTSDFTIVRNDAGVFAPASSHPIMGLGWGLAAADLDLDGDPDIAIPSSNNSVLIAHAQGGSYHKGLGLASGDYYMTFNVAFKQVPDPDPVFILADLFADWTAALSGRPDAILSLASPSPSVLLADGVDTSTLTIHLADREGLPVTQPIASVEVEQTSGPTLTIGPAIAQPDGSYTCDITAAGTPGIASLRVTVDDGIRPVVLMPQTGLTLIASPDLESDGDFDIFDMMAFQQAWSDKDPKADLNGDGIVDLQDAAAMLAYFAGK